MGVLRACRGRLKACNAVLATARSMRSLKYKQKLMRTGFYSLLLTLLTGNILRMLVNVLPITLIEHSMKVIRSCVLKMLIKTLFMHFFSEAFDMNTS